MEMKIIANILLVGICLKIVAVTNGIDRFNLSHTVLHKFSPSASFAPEEYILPIDKHFITLRMLIILLLVGQCRLSFPIL